MGRMGHMGHVGQMGYVGHLGQIGQMGQMSQMRHLGQIGRFDSYTGDLEGTILLPIYPFYSWPSFLASEAWKRTNFSPDDLRM